MKIAVTILKCTETLANLRCEVSGAEEALMRGSGEERAVRQREEVKMRLRAGGGAREDGRSHVECS